MFTMDLHNHTIFSYDGTNTPEEIIENALSVLLGEVDGIIRYAQSVRNALDVVEVLFCGTAAVLRFLPIVHKQRYYVVTLPLQ